MSEGMYLAIFKDSSKMFSKEVLPIYLPAKKCDLALNRKMTKHVIDTVKV